MLRGISRRYREVKTCIRGLLSTQHVVMAHIVPIRRCNLACKYCNEFDHVSPPVPIETILRRIDLLAALGTSIIGLTGGEPLMHPQVDTIIRYIRRRGMISGLITNGYFLTPEKIESLNRAGLDYLQISIDNVEPDEVSKKSLKVLDKKLVMLKRFGKFNVNINSVAGAGIVNPEDEKAISSRARQLGFSRSLGIFRDGNGGVRPFSERDLNAYELARRHGRRGFTRMDWMQTRIAEGKSNEWRCRAGARYLYICEDGLVHYCTQRRGCPGIPLENYTRTDMRREYLMKKPCAPFCSISTLLRLSVMDHWRDPQSEPEPAPPVREQTSTSAQSFSGHS
jgi:MoaA/NifB/PqqE/SkfB family radical SAM enzyme